MVTGVIRRIIRDAMRPRFQWRPYVLRRFFDTQLLIAESRGKIAHDFRVFFMGHKGSIEAVYTTNKGILPETLVNEMRDAFQRSQEFLDLEVENQDEAKKKEEVKSKIETMTAEQLAQVQELLSKLDGWKTNDANKKSSQQMMQRTISLGAGTTSLLCQTTKSLSKTHMIRTHSEDGLEGLRSLDL